MSKFKLLILLFASILIGCDLYDKASVVVDDVLNSCPDAVNVLESSFESKKIIFLGINDHATINTALFFSKENLQKLHDCGMRYILCEGGLSSKNLYDDSDLVQQEVELFYPWESVEAQYYENTVFQNVHSINRNLAQDEKIKVVGLEGRRQNFTIGDDDSRIYNYRDEYMFNVAREYIDGSKEDERILILCGSAHGYTDGVRRFNPQGNSEYEWITLGSRLKREYGDAFLSLSYIAVDSATRDSVFYGQLKKSDSWNTTNIVGKFVTLQDAEEINGAIPIFFDGNYPLYDGFIMDKHAEYGVKYCYKLDDPAVLELAIESCTETGRDSSEYAKMLEGLSNELGIDVDKVHLFLQGAWQLVQHSSLP